MFDVMQSRWFYLSPKYLVGKHPLTEKLILVLRNGTKDIIPSDIDRILSLNHLSIKGQLRSDDGIVYFELKESKNGNDKATIGGVPT